jgi:hypothetical protein
VVVKAPKLSKRTEAAAKKAEAKAEASEPLRLILLRHGKSSWAGASPPPLITST